ncbi:hypothetical protein FRC03_006345 [Tulasnella sp. 419]|nr:hypothetical protein FRC03_006345 [Tulasnella sp. 419]
MNTPTFNAVLQHIESRVYPAYPRLIDTVMHDWLLRPNESGLDELNKHRGEWLGDKVVNFIVGRLLHDAFPAATVGVLSTAFSLLVSNRVFARIACKLGMATNPNIKASANTFETYAWLLYRESQMTRLEPWIEDIFNPLVLIMKQLDRNRKARAAANSIAAPALPIPNKGQVKKEAKGNTPRHTVGATRTQPGRRAKSKARKLILLEPYSIEHRPQKFKKAPTPQPQQQQKSATRFVENADGVLELQDDSDDENSVEWVDLADEMAVEQTLASQLNIVIGKVLRVKAGEVEVVIPGHNIQAKVKTQGAEIEQAFPFAHGLMVHWIATQQRYIAEAGEILPPRAEFHQFIQAGQEIKVVITTEDAGEFACMDVRLASPWEM